MESRMLSNHEELLAIRRQLRECHEKASELIYISDPYIQSVMSEDLDYSLDKLMDLIEGEYDFD